MQNYEELFVPGLLQSAEATRAIIEGAAPTVSEVELDNLVAARMARDSKNSTGRSRLTSGGRRAVMGVLTGTEKANHAR